MTNPGPYTVTQTIAWFPVQWTTTGTVGNVNVDESIDGGAHWTRLASNQPNNGQAGVYLVATPSSNCYIRVQDVSGAPTGISAQFTQN